MDRSVKCAVCPESIGKYGSRGYCGIHYSRLRNHGDPLYVKPPTPTECSWGNCERKRHKGPLCSAHAERKRRGVDMDRPIQVAKWDVFTCFIRGCEKPVRTAMLCMSHSRAVTVYSMTAVQLDNLFARGACDICRTPLGIGEFHIDHDHSCCPGEKSCGRCVRGVVCSGCNLGMGCFKDSTERLMQAAAYLESRKF